MALTAVCPKCQQAGEHSDIYRGCMRPCPNCGELVSLATPEDAPIRRLPTEECWCRQPRDERGICFELGYQYRVNPSFLSRHFFLARVLLGSQSERIETMYVKGWACENCCQRIWSLVRWFQAPYWIVPAFWATSMAFISTVARISTKEQWWELVITWSLISLLVIAPIVIVCCNIGAALVSEPLKRRFGKGDIVSVKISR